MTGEAEAAAAGEGLNPGAGEAAATADGFTAGEAAADGLAAAAAAGAVVGAAADAPAGADVAAAGGGVLPLHAAIRLLAPATNASPSRLRRERTIRRPA